MDYLDLFHTVREQATINRLSSATERKAKLVKFKNNIMKNQGAIREAVYADLKRPHTETDLVDFLPVIVEIKDAIKNVKKWMKPKKVGTPLILFGTKSEIRYEPKGTVLIISPWNYPVNLLFSPLIAAIAAGNSCILKPSEYSPHTNEVMKQIISDTFPASEVCVVEGDAQTSQQLLELPFDHIFFTGSTRVGQIVLQAAAKHLASVTLELGGKSPAILDRGIDLKLAAERIVWSKFINAGQTCVATDYVLTHKDDLDGFLQECKKAVHQAYGDTESPAWSPLHYGGIVNTGHYDRLKNLCEEAIKMGARTVLGGSFDKSPYLRPTILTNVSLDSRIMKEEIFGPVLPILTYSSYEDIESVVSQLDRPLALYLFTIRKSFAERILGDFPSGGVCINTAVLHLGNSNLPFGGIGPSGMGNYHGHFGFRAFSHERAVLQQGPWEPAKFFRPPYTPRLGQLVRFVMKYFS